VFISVIAVRDDQPISSEGEEIMAVYYRYRSGVDTFSVPVAMPAISVGDLKRLILGPRLSAWPQNSSGR
jgi:hypothetical protein